MTQDTSRLSNAGSAEEVGNGNAGPTSAAPDAGYGSEDDSPGTETGSASVNAVYPSPSSGSTGVTDADVSDMNADRTEEVDTGNDVPGVRSG